MSDYEKHRGELIKIKDNVSKDEMIEFAKNIINKSIPENYDIFEYMNNYDYPYYFSDNAIYEIQNKRISNEDEFWYKQNDNTINYSFSFYNGGTCLSEQIKKLIKIIEKEE